MLSDRLIGQAADDWRLPRSVIVVFAVTPIVLPLLVIAGGLFYRPLFDALTGEDRFGEWAQFAAWLGALLFVIAILVRLMRSRSTLLAVLYLALVVAIVFIAGEEVSWGQRVFGFHTPEIVEEANRQGEFNLHNIFGVQTLFSWGMAVVGAYGAFAPLWAIKRWGPWASWPDTAKAVIVHWLLIPSFLLLFVWRLYRNLIDPPEGLYFGISEFGEITELLLALAMLAFVFDRWRSRATAPQPHPGIASGDS